MKPARISVIIPAYNAERTVSAAISSVIAQTYRDIEVIVIDDGSGDATAAIVAQWVAKDTRIRFIRQSNRGVSAARNCGIEAATGDWVALLDADDLFAPERLEKLLPQALMHSADLLADNLRVSVEQQGVVVERHNAFPDDRMSLGGPIQPTTFVRCDRPKWGVQSAGFIKPLIRRSFLENSQVRYPEQITAGEDFYFYLMCLIAGARLYFIPDAFYEYTLKAVSLSHGDDDRVISQYVAASRQLKLEAELRNIPSLILELDRRETDMINWLAFLAVTRELKARRYLSSCRAFLRLPSRLDGAYRLLAMLRYNVAVRLGITLRPKLPKN